jgi:predicted MPP superfamily phosphohydrolase
MMRLIVFIVLFLAIDFYAFQAVRLALQSSNQGLRTGLYFLFWSIPLVSIAYVFLAGTGATEPWPKSINTYFTAFIFIVYVSKFLILPFLFIDDLWRGVRYLIQDNGAGPTADASRSRFLVNTGLILGSLPFLTLTYGMIRNPYRYKVFRKKVPLANLPDSLDGLRIVQISDIHSGSFTYKEPIRAAIELINKEEADLVFFTGDLVNDQAVEMQPYVDLFSQIRAKRGVYSVLGNHDYGDYHEWPSKKAKEANFQALVQTHSDLGWDLLRNEHRRLSINGTDISVIGVENYSAMDRFPKHGDLAKAYAGCEDCALKILLSHDPSHWDYEVVDKYSDINLTLSGHTHGMQFGVEIPGFIKWSPIKYMYKQWAGLYQRNQQYLYVNRGLGFLGYPGRVGILPEITSLELRKA